MYLSLVFFIKKVNGNINVCSVSKKKNIKKYNIFSLFKISYDLRVYIKNGFKLYFVIILLLFAVKPNIEYRTIRNLLLEFDYIFIFLKVFFLYLTVALHVNM